jgi:hypothetical protein
MKRILAALIASLTLIGCDPKDANGRGVFEGSKREGLDTVRVVVNFIPDSTKPALLVTSSQKIQDNWIPKTLCRYQTISAGDNFALVCDLTGKPKDKAVLLEIHTLGVTSMRLVDDSTTPARPITIAPFIISR